MGDNPFAKVCRLSPRTGGQTMVLLSCTDPEIFPRGGPILTCFLFFFFFFFFNEGREDPIAIKAGHHRPACETPVVTFLPNRFNILKMAFTSYD